MPNRNLVLVVDDDPGMLSCVERLLRQHAYETMLFSSAEAFNNHTDFEKAVCVILDINLNDGSGIELRRGLTDAGVSVPVIYMTGDENAELWMHRVSYKALFRAVAHWTAQESIGTAIIALLVDAWFKRLLWSLRVFLMPTEIRPEIAASAGAVMVSQGTPLPCRSCKKGRSAPPVHMIKLTGDARDRGLRVGGQRSALSATEWLQW
jgi:CheY-like chemotaxis protein